MKNHPTRRQFLRTGTATAAALGFPAILVSRSHAKPAADGLIRIAQIGCGRIGKTMDMPGILKHHKLARFVAVCDVDSQRAAMGKEWVGASYQKSLGETPEIAVSGNYRELLARDDIDAVSISTPDHWHAQPVIEAALAGKHIYVQKPLTLTLAEGIAVDRIVRAKKRILQIGSQQRSTEQFHRACQLVRNGRIGKVHTVKIGLPTDPAGGDGKVIPVPETFDYDQWLGSTKQVPYTKDRTHDQKNVDSRPGWLRLNQFTHGMITGWGAHHVDIAHWGMGTEYTGPVSVKAEAEWPGSDSFWDVHGAYNVELKYANGATVLISDKLPNGIRFEGDKGWIWVSRGSYSATKSDPNASNTAKAIDASDKSWLTCDLSKDEVQLHRSPGWDHHLDWLQALKEERDAVTNVTTGHRSCSACMVSWIGMKLARPLKWDPDKQRFDDDEANSLMARAERDPYGTIKAAGKAGV